MATENTSTIAGLARSILKSAREADDLVADDNVTAKLDEIQGAAERIQSMASLSGAEAELPKGQPANEYRIPESLCDWRTIDTHVAALKSAKHFTKADGQIAVAWDLCETLRGFLSDTDIAESLQAATVVKIAQKHLEKAQGRLDRHISDYNNLFVAYFAEGRGLPKEKPQAEEPAPPAA